MESFNEKIRKSQAFLQKNGIDGWLLYDFKKLNSLACLFLEIPESFHLTRRFFYWIPKEGEPVKLVSAIENPLSHLPGKEITFSSWKSLHEKLEKLLSQAKVVAMEYSPMGATPEVAKVDAGTIELIRHFGPEVVSSGDLYQSATCVLSDKQVESHMKAAKFLDETVEKAFRFIAKNLGKTDEHQVQQFILQEMKENGFITDSPPIVAVNEHSADPHFSPSKTNPALIQENDFILIDLWCKQDAPGSVYADITRVGAAAASPAKEQKEIFDIVKAARDSAAELVCERFREGQKVYGWEVDDAARDVIRAHGYEEYFIHRTGHNIHENDHGPGAHNDNLETQDKRELLKGTCCSIEPGIYLPGRFGVRLEYDLLIGKNGQVTITGGVQNEIASAI